MTKGNINYISFNDIFDNPSLLDCEEDSEFFEWYSMEGSERLNELSRQLRTYFNYKSAIIHFRFSETQEGDNTIKKDPTNQWENNLISLISRQIKLISTIGAEEKTVPEKILILVHRIKTQKNNQDINLLKEIKRLGGEIWKIIHILSQSEIHQYPHLLNLILKIAGISCSIDSAFYWPFSRFFEELNLSYLQIEKELSSLLVLNGKEQFKAKKKERRARILE